MSFCAFRGKSAAAGRQRGRTGKRPEQQRKKERFILTSIPRQLLLQVILILLNAFFAAAEIAVVSLNGTKPVSYTHLITKTRSDKVRTG